MQAPRAGTTLGQYELIRVIGSGGMGVVYEARHRTLGRRVAMKLLHERDAALPGDEVRSARFLREGRAAAQVTHAHVVDVFDFGVEDGVPFLVMEFIEGETLAQRITREGALPLRVTIELMMPVLSAVAELHAAGVTHRDLKPANILLARERSGEICPKVGDFGVSRVNDGTAAVTESNAVVGTFAYMSPEQARSARETTERSDQYSLGVILYECVTGVRPFDASAPYELLHAIMHGTLAPPSARNPNLPPELDAIVARAMARDPESRFGALEELGEALLALASPEVVARWEGEFCGPRSPSAISVPSLSIVSRPDVLPAGSSAGWRRSRKMGFSGIGALAIVAVAGMSLALGRPPSTTPTAREAPAPVVTLASVVVPAPASTPEPAKAPPTADARPPSPSAAVPPLAPRRASSPSPRAKQSRDGGGIGSLASSAAKAPPSPAIGENGAPILDP